MKKRGRLSGEQGETCLLIAESGAPWTECAARWRAQARELETVVRLPHEQASTLSLILHELLGGGAVTASLEGPRGEPLRRLAHLAAV
ncbi:hypothetical protein WMF37_50295 [Sorangium sp. So ce291]|uniref:hypothetical protein n=1 Tax=Sorangium sp. So ce291 TaxID=3133294 RepID=UPI003F608707